MKKLIYLYGGPGTGKSTTAAHIFALSKTKGYNSELIREYIKNWVWEKRSILTGDEIYLWAKQTRLERIGAQNNLDLMVSDSPPWLSLIYNKDFYTETIRQLCITHEKHLKDKGYSIHHIFLNRVKEYNPAGRFQSKEAAVKLDTLIQHTLQYNNLPFTELPANIDAAEIILEGVL